MAAARKIKTLQSKISSVCTHNKAQSDYIQWFRIMNPHSLNEKFKTQNSKIKCYVSKLFIVKFYTVQFKDMDKIDHTGCPKSFFKSLIKGFDFVVYQISLKAGS